MKAAGVTTAASSGSGTAPTTTSFPEHDHDGRPGRGPSTTCSSRIGKRNPALAEQKHQEVLNGLKDGDSAAPVQKARQDGGDPGHGVQRPPGPDVLDAAGL